MKNLSFLGLALAAAITLQACQSADKRSSTQKDSVAGDSNMVNNTQIGGTPNTETKVNERAIDFIKKAAAGGMMEVEAAKIAQTNAKNDEVKKFADKMLVDHTKANAELKALAISKNVMIPASLSSDEQMHLDEMKKMKGDSFDKHYIGMMVDDHVKTVELFKEGAKNADTDVKNWAEKTLKVIEEHTALAEKINAKIK